jgi:hypothetical protein
MGRFHCEQLSKMIPWFLPGVSEDPGPGPAGGVPQGCREHGGLLHPLPAPGHGAVHPVGPDAVGGRTARSLGVHVGSSSMRQRDCSG